MPTLVEALQILKQHLFYNNVSFSSVLQKHDISDLLGLYLAKQFLGKEEYVFSSLSTGEEIDISTVFTLNEDIVCKPPMSRRVDVFDIDTFTEVLDPGIAFDILNDIAAAAEKGLTSPEITQRHNTKNVHIIIDKLVVTGALVKRSMMPLLSSSKTARAKSICVILHLKKYAALYRAVEDGCQLLPDEEFKDEFMQFLLELLDSNGIEMIPTKDLSRAFNLSKRQGGYLRHHVLTQARQGNCVLEAQQRRCAPLKDNLKPGRIRTAWCIAKAVKHPEMEMDTRVRNLSLMEAVDLYLRRRGEVVANDLRKLTALGRKRAQRLATDLSAVYKYPAVRVQYGRVIQNKIMAKSSAAPGEGDAAEAAAAAEDLQENSAAALIGSPAPQSAAKSAKAPTVKQLRASAAKRLRGSEDEGEAQASDAEDGVAVSLTTNVRRRDSMERTERLLWFQQYLDKLQHGVGSMLEVSQVLRTLHRDKFNVGTIDKKTILRLAQTFVDNGVIEQCDVDLDDSQAQNFGGGVRTVTLFAVKNFPGDKRHRIEEYLNSYVHVKTVYKKKEETPLADKSYVQEMEVEPAHVEEEAIQPVALDGLLNESLLLDYDSLLSSSAPPPPKKRRARRSKTLAVVPAVADEPRTPAPTPAPVVAFSESLLDHFAAEVLEKETATPGIAFDDVQYKKRNTEALEKKGRRPGTGWREPWTPDEVSILLAMFIDNYFTRKARSGLPNSLKPMVAKRIPGLKSTFLVNPWNSVFDVIGLNHNLAAIRTFYVNSSVLSLPAHRNQACKNRMFAITRTFESMAHLIAYFLWKEGGDVSVGVRENIEFLFKRELRITRDDAAIAKDIVSRVFKEMGETFCVGQFLKQNEQYDALVPRVLRELYMHGALSSAAPSPQVDSLQQALYFSRSYLKLPKLVRLGGFIAQTAGDCNDEEEGPNSDTRGLLSFAHSLPTLLSPFGPHHAKPPLLAELSVRREESDAQAAEDREVRVTVGDSEFSSPLGVPTIDNSGLTSVQKSTDRLNVDVSYTSTYLSNFEEIIQSIQSPASPEEKALPWFDKDGNVNVKCFRHFALEILLFLTDFPQATSKQLHEKIILWPFDVVQLFLDRLVSEKILKYTETTTLKIDSPFQTQRQLWGSAPVASVTTTRFYSHNFSS